jgi:hypothetical protein
MSEPQYLIQASYRGNTVEVWPVESFTKVNGKTFYVFDFIVNGGYYGTVRSLVEVEKTLTMLRTRIENGDKIWE